MLGCFETHVGDDIFYLLIWCCAVIFACSCFSSALFSAPPLLIINLISVSAMYFSKEFDLVTIVNFVYIQPCD